MNKQSEANNEYKTVNVRVFRTSEGLPTCLNTVLEVCVFFKFHGRESREYCHYHQTFLSRYRENGNLKPTDECPLWSKSNE